MVPRGHMKRTLTAYMLRKSTAGKDYAGFFSPFSSARKRQREESCPKDTGIIPGGRFFLTSRPIILYYISFLLGRDEKKEVMSARLMTSSKQELSH